MTIIVSGNLSRFIFNFAIALLMFSLTLSAAQGLTNKQACEKCCSGVIDANLFLESQVAEECITKGCERQTCGDSFPCIVGKGFRDGLVSPVQKDAFGDLRVYKCNLETGEVTRDRVSRFSRCESCCYEAETMSFFAVGQSVSNCINQGCVDKAICTNKGDDCRIGLAFRDRMQSLWQIDQNGANASYTCLSTGHIALSTEVYSSSCTQCCSSAYDLGFLQQQQNIESCIVPGCYENDCSSAGLACEVGKAFSTGIQTHFQEDIYGNQLSYICNPDGTVTPCPVTGPACTVAPTTFPTRPDGSVAIPAPTSFPTRPDGSIITQNPTSFPTRPDGSIVTQNPTSFPTRPDGSIVTQSPTSFPTGPDGSIVTQNPTSFPTRPDGSVITQHPTSFPTRPDGSIVTQIPTAFPTRPDGSITTQSPTRPDGSTVPQNPTAFPTRPDGSIFTQSPTSFPTRPDGSIVTQQPTSFPSRPDGSIVTQSPTSFPTRPDGSIVSQSPTSFPSRPDGTILTQSPTPSSLSVNPTPEPVLQDPIPEPGGDPDNLVTIERNVPLIAGTSAGGLILMFLLGCCMHWFFCKKVPETVEDIQERFDDDEDDKKPSIDPENPENDSSNLVGIEEQESNDKAVDIDGVDNESNPETEASEEEVGNVAEESSNASNYENHDEYSVYDDDGNSDDEERFDSTPFLLGIVSNSEKDSSDNTLEENVKENNNSEDKEVDPDVKLLSDLEEKIEVPVVVNSTAIANRPLNDDSGFNPDATPGPKHAFPGDAFFFGGKKPGGNNGSTTDAGTKVEGDDGETNKPKSFFAGFGSLFARGSVGKDRFNSEERMDEGDIENVSQHANTSNAKRKTIQYGPYSWPKQGLTFEVAYDEPQQQTEEKNDTSFLRSKWNYFWPKFGSNNEDEDPVQQGENDSHSIASDETVDDSNGKNDRNNESAEEAVGGTTTVFSFTKLRGHRRKHTDVSPNVITENDANHIANTLPGVEAITGSASSLIDKNKYKRVARLLALEEERERKRLEEEVSQDSDDESVAFSEHSDEEAHDDDDDLVNNTEKVRISSRTVPQKTRRGSWSSIVLKPDDISEIDGIQGSADGVNDNSDGFYFLEEPIDEDYDPTKPTFLSRVESIVVKQKLDLEKQNEHQQH